MKLIKNFYYSIQHFFENLARVIHYFPIIWKNKDWDFIWIYRLLSYKLKRVEKCLSNDSYHVNAVKSAKQVMICRVLLERLERDEYCKYEWLKHDEKWGQLEHRYEDGRKTGIKLILYREKCKTEEEKSLERKESKRLMEEEEQLKNQGLEMFWKIFKKHHQTWWI